MKKAVLLIAMLMTVVLSGCSSSKSLREKDLIGTEWVGQYTDYSGCTCDCTYVFYEANTGSYKLIKQKREKEEYTGTFKWKLEENMLTLDYPMSMKLLRYYPETGHLADVEYPERYYVKKATTK